LPLKQLVQTGLFQRDSPDVYTPSPGAPGPAEAVDASGQPPAACNHPFTGYHPFAGLPLPQACCPVAGVIAFKPVSVKMSQIPVRG